MKKLSIIIPIHNEGKYIEQTIEKVVDVSIPYEKEIIIIDDGSSDNTQEILENLKTKYNLIVLKHNKNTGKGSAIKTGLSRVTGELLIIQDGDMEYNPIDIPLLLNKVTNEISAVYGNRGTKKWPKRGYHYVLGAKILTNTINLLYGEKLQDIYTGYKLFNLKKININLLKNLKSIGFEFEAEVTCKILKINGEIIEVPINYIPRSRAEGKHIGLKDAFLGFFTILKNI